MYPNDKYHLAARDAMQFIDSHPAFGGSPYFNFMSLLSIDIEAVNDLHHAKPFKGLWSVFWTPENYKRFKKEFDKEFKEEPGFPKRLTKIDVPYEKVYGKKWKPNHIEYWGELSFVVYMGKGFKSKEANDQKRWVCLSGIEASGASFEDLVTVLEKEVKKIFGNFNSYDSFLTNRERKNNKGKRSHLFKPVKSPSPYIGSIMVRNKDYIHVSQAEMNRRWLKWFSKTPYCKKLWADTVKSILAGKDHL